MRKPLIMLLSVFVAWQTWNMSFAGTSTKDGIEVQGENFSNEYLQTQIEAQILNHQSQIGGTGRLPNGYPQMQNGGSPILPNGGLPQGYPQYPYPQPSIGGTGSLPNNYPQPQLPSSLPNQYQQQYQQSQDMTQLKSELESLWSGKRMECDDGLYPFPPDDCNACNSQSCAERHGFYKTWGQIKAGNCYPAGSDCAWSIDLGFITICLRTAYFYCCYDSRFSKDLVEEANGQLGNLFNPFSGCLQLSVNDLKKLDLNRLNPKLRSWLESKMGRHLEEELDGNTILKEVKEGINHMYGKYRGKDKVEVNGKYHYNDNGIKMIEKIYDDNNNNNNSENSIINQLENESQEMINGN